MRVLLVLLVCLGAGGVLPAQSDAQAPATPPVVRSITFPGFQGIPIKEILQRLKDSGVRLNVERPYSADDVEAARKVLEEMLEEKGRSGAKVKSEVTPMPPHAVKVVFTAVLR